MRISHSNPKQSTPSFFKILLDNTSPNLPLPPAFVRNQFVEDTIPENPVLKTGFGERSWRVKIEEIGGKYCFVNGWLDFVKDTKSEVGDFLVFWLIGKSTFKVSIFGPNACEKNLISAISTPCLYDCSRSRICDADLKNVIKIEEDDDDDDDGEEEEEEEKDGDDESDEEEEESDDEVKDEDFMNPSFEKVIKKSDYYTMRLPSRFVNESGIDKQRNTPILIGNKERKEWTVKIGKSFDRVYLGNGWTDFWRDNKLMEGDTCSFKYLHGEEGSHRRSRFIEFEIVNKVPRKRGRPSKYFHGEEDSSRSSLIPRKRGRPAKSQQIRQTMN